MEGFSKKLKTLVLGKSHDFQDHRIFHRLSLIAFFAWVGLGADGLSSSCYGPQEAFLALKGHTYLSIFVALGTVLTIWVISTSYSQIVELFPSGGGGYLVASKLLSPTVGMISGCALLIDYVLTITVSIASSADALFSLGPLSWQTHKLAFAVAMLFFMIVLNMRGIKESIIPLIPVFLIFLITHIFIIFYAVFTHLPRMPEVVALTTQDVHSTISQVGFWGMIFLILRAYTMGAGTYTGIEAVSNGMPVLREPRVETAKSTMRYMAISLAFVAMGLIVGYLLFNLTAQPGKTLNAFLFEQATAAWGVHRAAVLIIVALASEALLLMVAAQAGFLDGPRVLANMAKDRWFPIRFSTLSDRLVVQNGILIMGGLAAALMILTHGSVRLLVVLYSINVFITFVLSQTGMVRYWWSERRAVRNWFHKFLVNGIGLILCVFILLTMVILKFHEGGWITLLITATLVFLAIMTKRHYLEVAKMLRRLNSLVSVAEAELPDTDLAALSAPGGEPKFDPKAKTAVVFVNGFNGMGLHTLFGIIRLFGFFKNFIFVEVGLVDAGNFKGTSEIENLRLQVKADLDRYVKFMNRHGFYAEGVSDMGTDVIEEITDISPKILERFPNAIFFGGQLVFPNDSFMLRFLHNYTVFLLQKRLYRQGIPLVILPIRV